MIRRRIPTATHVLLIRPDGDAPWRRLCLELASRHLWNHGLRRTGHRPAGCGLAASPALCRLSLSKSGLGRATSVPVNRPGGERSRKEAASPGSRPLRPLISRFDGSRLIAYKQPTWPAAHRSRTVRRSTTTSSRGDCATQCHENHDENKQIAGRVARVAWAGGCRVPRDDVLAPRPPGATRRGRP